MSTTEILQHRYLIHPHGLSSREGALIWARFEDGSQGFADLMAWPELGDLTLDEELARLRSGSPGRLGARSLEMASIDARSRQRGKSLWKGVLDPPISHLLLGAYSDLAKPEALDALEDAAIAGFRSIKLKWEKGLDPAEAISILAPRLPYLRDLGLKLRVDFNEKASFSEVDQWLSYVQKVGGTDRLSYLEDPVSSGNPEQWAALKARYPDVPLFVDCAVDEAPLRDIADGWVVKPASQNPHAFEDEAVKSGKIFLITHSLGHPVGAAFAAWYAARSLDEIGECGLILSADFGGEDAYFMEALRDEDETQSRSAKFPTQGLREGEGIGWSEEDFSRLSWEPVA